MGETLQGVFNISEFTAENKALQHVAPDFYGTPVRQLRPRQAEAAERAGSVIIREVDCNHGSRDVVTIERDVDANGAIITTSVPRVFVTQPDRLDIQV